MYNMMTNKQINLVKNTFDIIDIKKTESFKKSVVHYTMTRKTGMTGPKTKSM